jgi:hypothetical protein
VFEQVSFERKNKNNLMPYCKIIKIAIVAPVAMVNAF